MNLQIVFVADKTTFTQRKNPVQPIGALNKYFHCGKKQLKKEKML